MYASEVSAQLNAPRYGGDGLHGIGVAVMFLPGGGALKAGVMHRYESYMC